MLCLILLCVAVLPWTPSCKRETCPATAQDYRSPRASRAPPRIDLILSVRPGALHPPTPPGASYALGLDRTTRPGKTPDQLPMGVASPLAKYSTSMPAPLSVNNDPMAWAVMCEHDELPHWLARKPRYP